MEEKGSPMVVLLCEEYENRGFLKTAKVSSLASKKRWGIFSLQCKLLVIIIISLAPLPEEFLPIFSDGIKGFLSLGTQFAGGVFLGTTLMHFLSDSAETFKDLREKEYPFAFMLCTVGYLVTMLGDLVVTLVYVKQSDKT